MKIKCLKNVCSSGVGLEAGKTYDVSSADPLAHTFSKHFTFIKKKGV